MTNLTNLNHFPGGGGGGGGGVTNSSNRSNFTSVNTLNSATALSGAGGSGVGGGNATLSLGSPVISNLLQSSASSSNSQACTFSPVHPLSSYSASVYTFVFLFTSDFERNAWLEELNGAIYACKSKTLKSNFNSTILISSKVFFIFVKILDKARKNTIYIQQSDIEARINSLKVIHFFRALHLRWSQIKRKIQILYYSRKSKNRRVSLPIATRVRLSSWSSISKNCSNQIVCLVRLIVIIKLDFFKA